MKTKPQIVTVRNRVEAYYSDYAKNPESYLEPGMYAIVVNTSVPFVRAEKGGVGKSGVLVDFCNPFVFEYTKDPTDIWRAVIEKPNVVKVQSGEVLYDYKACMDVLQGMVHLHTPPDVIDLEDFYEQVNNITQAMRRLRNCEFVLTRAGIIQPYK